MVANQIVSEPIQYPGSEVYLQGELQMIKHTEFVHQGQLEKRNLGFGSFVPIDWEYDDIAALRRVYCEILLSVFTSETPTISDLPEGHIFFPREILNIVMRYRREILQLLKSDVVVNSAHKKNIIFSGPLLIPRIFIY